MSETRVLTDEELERGLQTFLIEEHKSGTVSRALAIALNTVVVERQKRKRLERKVENAVLTLMEEEGE